MARLFLIVLCTFSGIQFNSFKRWVTVPGSHITVFNEACSSSLYSLYCLTYFLSAGPKLNWHIPREATPGHCMLPLSLPWGIFACQWVLVMGVLLCIKNRYSTQYLPSSASSCIFSLLLSPNLFACSSYYIYFQKKSPVYYNYLLFQLADQRKRHCEWLYVTHSTAHEDELVSNNITKQSCQISWKQDLQVYDSRLSTPHVFKYWELIGN